MTEKSDFEYLPADEGVFWDADQIAEDVFSKISLSDKSYILKNIKSEDGMGLFHMTVGMSIRNTYKLWFKDYPHLDGAHPDDYSYEILKKIWNKVKTEKS